MADKNVIEIVGNAPEKEQDGDQDERNELPSRKQMRSPSRIRPRGNSTLDHGQRHGSFRFATHITAFHPRRLIQADHYLCKTLWRLAPLPENAWRLFQRNNGANRLLNGKRACL